MCYINKQSNLSLINTMRIFGAKNDESYALFCCALIFKNTVSEETDTAESLSF